MSQKKNRTTINLDSFQSSKVLSLKCIIHFILKSFLLGHSKNCPSIWKHWKITFHDWINNRFEIEVRFVLIYTTADDLRYSSREQLGKELRPYWLFVRKRVLSVRILLLWAKEHSLRESYQKYLNKTTRINDLPQS